MLIQAQLETNISREDNNEKLTIFRLIEDFYSKILGFFFWVFVSIMKKEKIK